MIRHTKLAKSNVPILTKPKKKKKLKKVFSSCNTPKKVFSKSTSRNGSPNPKTTRNIKKITTKIPKLKVYSTSPRLKLSSIVSYTSRLNIQEKDKTLKKNLKKTSNLKNSNQKNIEKSNSIISLKNCKDSIDLKEKKFKASMENMKSNKINYLKQMLQQILKENEYLKHKLKKLNDSQEEPKSLMNTNYLDILGERIKNKLKDLKKKFI